MFPMCPRPVMCPIRFILPVSLVLLLSACASTGSSRYSCGVPEGQPCRSALQVYAETDALPAAVPVRSGDDAVIRKNPDPWQLNQRADGELVLVATPPDPVPTVRAPTPVRTEARILRIWIAPFENADGDLVAGSHLYTEIEPRRWRYGQAALPATPSLSLLPESSTPISQIATETKSANSN